MTFNPTKADQFLAVSLERIAAMTAKSAELKDQRVYYNIRKRLDQMCSRLFNYSSTDVHFFGSRIMGIGTDESDLDVYIVLEGSFDLPFVKDEDHDKRYRRLLEALKISNVLWEYRGMSPDARIPTLTFEYLPMKVHCEINIANGLGTCNSRLLQEMFSLQPEAVSLFHFFRQFLKEQGFTHFKGYTLALLVVFYLQTKEFLPPVESLQRNTHPQLIDGWNVKLKERPLAEYGIEKKVQYRDHIVDIFKFYSNFDFSKVMSVPNAKILDPEEHVAAYPEFDLTGIRIIGPINKKRNCGIVEESVKNNFIQLIKASADHLAQTLMES